MGPPSPGGCASHFPYRPMAWNRLAWDRVLSTGPRQARPPSSAHLDRPGRTPRRRGREGLAGWWLTEQPTGCRPTNRALAVPRPAPVRARLHVPGSHPRTRRVVRTDILVRPSTDDPRQRLRTGRRLEHRVSAGHGFSVDLAIADESWRLKPECIDDGVIPSMRARPQPAARDDVDRRRRDHPRCCGIGANVAWPRSSPATRHRCASWNGRCRPAPTPTTRVCGAGRTRASGSTLTADTLLAESHGPRSTFLRASPEPVGVSRRIRGCRPASGTPAGSRRGPTRPAGWSPPKCPRAATASYAAARLDAQRHRLRRPAASSPNPKTNCGRPSTRVYGDVDQLVITPTLQLHLPPAMQPAHRPRRPARAGPPRPAGPLDDRRRPGRPRRSATARRARRPGRRDPASRPVHRPLVRVDRTGAVSRLGRRRWHPGRPRRNVRRWPSPARS